LQYGRELFNWSLHGFLPGLSFETRKAVRSIVPYSGRGWLCGTSRRRCELKRPSDGEAAAGANA
jgi:hypothetical protein